MSLAVGVALTPVVGALATRSSRSLAGIAAAAMLAWLNVWWLVPLLGSDAVVAALPPFLTATRSPLVMTAGHLLVATLVLAAIGVFSPRAGSPADLAIKAARRGDHRAAGESWLEGGRPRRALRSFLRGHAWGRAAELARARGQLVRAAELLRREGGESLAAAAQLFARAGHERAAAASWLRCGQYLIERGRPEEAIEPFSRAADPRRAAHAVELALQGHRLGTAHVDAATRAARDANQPALGAAAALACGRPREAGELFLAAEQPADAARAFAQAGEALRAADALRLAGRNEDAARLRGRTLFDAGKPEQALEEYTAAGMAAETAPILEQLGRHRQAFDAYRQGGLTGEAARLAREHLDPREAAPLFAELGDWDHAGEAWEAAGELREAARCYEQGGDLARAEEVLARGGLAVELGSLLARTGRVEDGVRALVASGEMRAAWELLAPHGGRFPALAEPLVAIGSWLAEHGEATAAISAVQRALANGEVRRESLPAAYALAELLERHGDLRAAEEAWRQVVAVDYAFRDAGERLQRLAARHAAAEPTPGAPVAPAAAGTTDPAVRYVLEQELGRGGMGVVYRARDTRLGRTVAIKILNPRQHTPEAIRRFEREARSAAALSHPGIVHIYDFDRGFSSFFISMEFVSGPTLLQMVREEPPFVRRHLLALMHQIADAAGYAHARHVIHRDLKPANMIFADRQQVKILDFGIARRLDELDLSASGATGTPFYMAPEQVLGEPPDERADVYALGVTFFQMATGTLPFATGNVLRAHIEQPAPDPLALAPELDPALARLITRCLAKDPDQRPRDGAALLVALAGAERGGTA